MKVKWSEVGAGDFVELDGQQVEVINRGAVGERLRIRVAYYRFAAEAEVDPGDEVERSARWPDMPTRRLTSGAVSPADGWRRVPAWEVERWSA